MDLNEAIRYVHENPEVYLTPTGKKDGGYICPICGSGSGPHKTGIQADKKEPWKFTCFAHDCFPPKSDIINIIAAKEHLDNKKALFRALKTKSQTPKYGLIYHASIVGQANPKIKGKISFKKQIN